MSRNMLGFRTLVLVALGTVSTFTSAQTQDCRVEIANHTESSNVVFCQTTYWDNGDPRTGTPAGYVYEVGRFDATIDPATGVTYIDHGRYLGRLQRWGMSNIVGSSCSTNYPQMLEMNCRSCPGDPDCRR